LGVRFHSTEIALFHDSFTLLFDEIGLNVTLVLQRDPEVPPGPRRSHDLIEALKRGTTKTLIGEPQINPKFASMIQKESGHQIVTLDPLVTGTASPGVLLETLLNNLQELTIALEESE
jgi:zinc transport system substrate-binding protein